MTKYFSLACAVCVVLAGSAGQVHAQGRDSLVNGVVIGAAVGAGVGVAFTHAVRDSDLTFSQYARGALIFGAIGAGAGIGVDALLNRAFGRAPAPRRVSIAPALWRDVQGIAVNCNW